ncbi:MAG: carbohydrate-binding protein [Prolixibacteraceae bacterium]|jgi:arabinoxylan arabinofuranohydrolase|nr:carbohydrate-binding protein [Prolixibacteraceae bacterium]
MVKGVDFSKGAKSVEVSIASLYGGEIEIRIDKTDGPIIATVNVNTSRKGGIWRSFTAPVNKNIKGVHDVYFAFRGEKDLFNFDWWMFK